MKICIVPEHSGPKAEYIFKYKSKYNLLSFAYLKKTNEKDQKRIVKKLKKGDLFLLDSGAFTFMNSGGNINQIDKYMDEYIEFINKYDIKYFFELDLYTVIGIKKTEQLTKRLEKETGKKSIPVFHKLLGIDWFEKKTKEYNYIAVGASGLTEECKWVKNKNALKHLVTIAHKNNCKIHGLGYTRMENINTNKIPFDSVDSTSWKSGGRFGTMYYIKNNKIKTKNLKIKGYKIKNYLDLDEHNFKVWCMYQSIGDKL